MSCESFTPKRFSLGALDFNIKSEHGLLQKDDVVGRINFRTQKITINKFKKDEATQEYIDGIFFHELAHGILREMEEHDLTNNEKFVDRLGGLIHEYVKTARK